MPEPRFPLQSSEQLFGVTGKSVFGVTFPLPHHMSHFPGTERWKGRNHAALYISSHLKKICCIIWLLPNPITSPLGSSPASRSLDHSSVAMTIVGFFFLDSDHFLFSKSFCHKTSLTLLSHNEKKCTRSFVRADLSKVSHWFQFCLLFPIEESYQVQKELLWFVSLSHSSHYTFLTQLFQKLFEFNSLWFC